MVNPSSHSQRPSTTILTLIGIGKLFKSACLIVVAIGTMRLMHHDVNETLRGWIMQLRVDPDDRFFRKVLTPITGVSDRTLRELAVGTLFYAALFATEGIGLLLHKRWAEYFTIITTSLLLPLEVYEIFRRPTPIRIAVFIANVAVVIYLIVRVRKTQEAEPVGSRAAA